MESQKKIRNSFDIDGEELITKEKGHCEYIANNTNEETQCDTMDNSDEDQNFPWLDKFTSLMCSVIGNTNYELLEYLLTTYEKNVSRDFCRCFRSFKSFKSTKLKNHIRNTLNFFHFYWRNVKERVSDHYSFLDKMAEIVRMYLDLEVLTSSWNIDSAKILTALYIYLDNSEEHIFKILLKGKCVTKTFSKIYCPIFAKLLSNVKSSAESITNFTYARYLLAFKMWKTIVESLDEKEKITDMALIKLGSSVPKMSTELAELIPGPPEGLKSGTLWLMEFSFVGFRKTCDSFLMLEAKMHSSSLNEEFKNSQFDLVNDLQLKAHPAIDRILKTKPLPKKVKRPSPKLKPGEVLLIDLTSENEEVKQTSNKKHKIRKKPQWLKEVKVHHKFKKPQPFPKRTKWVEVADAHSTESCENFEKTLLENASLSKTAYNFDKFSVCSSIEENIVSSQTAENKANQKTSAEESLTNTCQKCNVTSNTTEQKTNTNETKPGLVNLNNTLLEGSNQDKSSISRQDIVHSSTTYVTSACDSLRSSVLLNKSIDIFNYTSEDISSQSGKKLPSDWENKSDKADVCAVSTTVADHVSESSSGVWTDYNSADSEAPDTLISPRSEISLNSCKIQQEEFCEEPKLDGPSTIVSDPQTPEKVIDVCLSEIVVKATPDKLENILNEEIDMDDEYQNFFENPVCFSDKDIPSDSLLEGSLGTTGILKSLLDFDLMGLYSSPSEFLYSNVQAIDPNLISKPPSRDDIEISDLFGKSPPASFISEEIIEEKEELEEEDDGADLLKLEVKVSKEPEEVVEELKKRKEQMKNEVSSTSRQITEITKHKRNSTVGKNLREGSESPKRVKRSRSSSFSFDSEEPLKKERRVQELLPFKKRQELRSHTYLNEIIQDKNLDIIKKDL